MDLAKKLVQLRKNKGWTQAIAAQNIAIQQSYLSKLENGHFHPSQEVIDKLCAAYQIKKAELIFSAPKQPINPVYWLLTTTIGLLLILNGHFSLLFNQTFYTYKTQPLIATQEQPVNLNYHLTDQYQGDKYLKDFSGIKYEYTLIAEREINRIENKWFIVIGGLIVLLSISALLLPSLKRKYLHP
ncbi:helix-turn-helix domain-containing protein [Colwelliaceae bacterium 6441]